MKRPIRNLLLVAVLVLGTVWASTDTEITHKIPPGYIPDEARDEQNSKNSNGA